MHVRVCRDCGEEYRPEIAVCADCGGELVDHREDAGGSPLERPQAGPGGDRGEDAEPERVLFASAQIRDLTPLADELARAEVPFRLAEDGSPRRVFYLCVPESACDDARRALAPVLESQPELAYLATAEPPVEVEDEPAHPNCPACETALPAGSGECPACGLAFDWNPEER